MTHYSKVLRGFAAYLDAEVFSKMTGSMKAWIVGGALELMILQSVQIFSQYKDHPAVAMLGVIEGENVDVDKLYAAFRKRAQNSPATIAVPLIGPITFSASDLDALYRHIKGA